MVFIGISFHGDFHGIEAKSDLSLFCRRTDEHTYVDLYYIDIIILNFFRLKIHLMSIITNVGTTNLSSKVIVRPIRRMTYIEKNYIEHN